MIYDAYFCELYLLSLEIFIVSFKINLIFFKKLDEAWKHCAELKKPDRKDLMVYDDSNDTECPEQENQLIER